jgi:hypothetical protein
MNSSPPKPLPTTDNIRSHSESSERRSRGPRAKWDRLDKLVNSPEYGNSRSWTCYPVLSQLQPGVDHPGRALKWTFDTTKEELDCVNQFCFGFQRVTGARTPHNSLQGESIYTAMFLARIIPFMARATMDSDLERMRELIGVGRDLLRVMEMLVNAEEESKSIKKHCQ